MNNNQLSTKFYLAQVYLSFPDYLTSTFQLQHHTFFRSTLGIHTKLNLDLFFNPHKKKMSLNKWENERWMNAMNQPILKKIQLKKWLGNQGKEDFLAKPNISNLDWRKRAQREWKIIVVVPRPKLETFELNMKRNPWSNGWKEDPTKNGSILLKSGSTLEQGTKTLNQKNCCPSLLKSFKKIVPEKKK